jgi:Uma2 family endonuclease
MQPAPQRFTAAEYLALEAASPTKHEFVNGTISAMAGAQPPHNVLAMNVGAALVALLRAGKDCVVMTSHQRVHVPATGLYTYPDVIVASGQRLYKDDNPPSLLNPTVLVEVTSDTTEDYDRGSKFLHYQSLESLREYVIVSHRERRLDRHRRLDSGEWLATAYTGDDARIELSSLGRAIQLAEVYEKVDFSEGRSA